MRAISSVGAIPVPARNRLLVISTLSLRTARRRFVCGQTCPADALSARERECLDQKRGVKQEERWGRIRRWRWLRDGLAGEKGRDEHNAQTCREQCR